jgi:hypothetical protein
MWARKEPDTGDTPLVPWSGGQRAAGSSCKKNFPVVFPGGENLKERGKEMKPAREKNG